MQNLQTKSFDDLQTLDEKFEYAKDLHPHGKYEEALVYFRILKDVYEEQQDYVSVMDCLGNICQCLGNTGRVAELTSYLVDYKMYCNLYGNEIHKYRLNFYLGFANFKAEENEAAIEYYLTALKLAQQLNDYKKYCVVLINLIGLYSLIQNAEKSYDIVMQLKQMDEQHPEYFSTNMRSVYLLNYMTILLQRAELDEFPVLMTRYEHLVQGLELKRDSNYYLYIQGRYFTEKGEPEKALPLLENAYKLIVATKELPTYHLILQSLINVYEQLEDYKSAFYYMKILNESYVEQDRLERIKIIKKISKQMDMDEFKELVYTDALTKVYNRRYLEEQGNLIIEQANDDHAEVFCAVIDIDDFKTINDSFGHIVGDEAIKQLAQKVKEYVKEYVKDHAIFTRYGGDEFVLLYKNIEEPVQFFEQLYSEFREVEATYKDILVKFTVSIGVACLSVCEEKTLSSLIHLADYNLYKSKQSGCIELTINSKKDA